jgi:L-rhamnose mutarotase
MKRYFDDSQGALQDGESLQRFFNCADGTLSVEFAGSRKTDLLRKQYGGKMPRHCLTLDLKDDQTAISEYKQYHVKIWPEIKQSLLDAGVLQMEIYLAGTRLFMMMDVSDGFSFSAKAAADAANAKVQEWETLMERFQQALPQSRPGQKWVVMEKVFDLAVQ